MMDYLVRRNSSGLLLISLLLAIGACARGEAPVAAPSGTTPSQTSLPASSAITSVEDVYGVGCPSGWEYRRFRSFLFDIQFRDRETYGEGPPPVWAEFHPFPDGFFDEGGDPRTFVEALAAVNEYRVEGIAEAPWQGK